eukprot:GEMP01039137.1.p1 GENE.GEMP01039137.1~~GEMP01039137.1.p1  ORF type:complete len:197 (+),score=18.11 GEMP01039137.1:30-620(+)
MTVSFDEIMPGGVLDAYFTDNRLRVSMFILFVELCERFTFYTIYGSMKAFLQDHHFSQSHSTSISLVFSTTCYLWTIAGSICTDAYYSRYTVIAISLITYLIGGITIIVATLPTISSTTMYLTRAKYGHMPGYGVGKHMPDTCAAHEKETKRRSHRSVHTALDIVLWGKSALFIMLMPSPVVDHISIARSAFIIYS